MSQPGARAQIEKMLQQETVPEDREVVGQRFQSTRTYLMMGGSAIARPNLGNFKLFQKCSVPFLERMTESLTQKTFDKGATIMKQGATGKTMYLLSLGEVEVLAGEMEEVVATLGCGTLLGEMAVISRNPAASKRTATIRAKTFCNCWMIDRQSLLKILNGFPEDEVIMAAEADRRIQDLESKGFITNPERERRWQKVKDVVTTDAFCKRLSTMAIARHVANLRAIEQAELNPLEEGKQGVGTSLTTKPMVDARRGSEPAENELGQVVETNSISTLAPEPSTSRSLRSAVASSLGTPLSIVLPAIDVAKQTRWFPVGCDASPSSAERPWSPARPRSPASPRTPKTPGSAARIYEQCSRSGRTEGLVVGARAGQAGARRLFEH